MTSFDKIYKKFLNKISDIKLLSLDETDVKEMLYEWMTSAITNMKAMESDLSDRDEETEMFNDDVLDVEIEVLSNLMVVEWLKPQLNSTLLTSQYFGDSEKKFYSQANQLDQLIALSKKNELDTQKRIRDYEYRKYISENLEL